jgi:hypothetical protein
MPYIGNTPALDYISFAVQNFTVTAGTTVYTLDYSVSNENDIALYINSVAQRPGASFAYSATGTTLTLTSATLVTDTMYAVFIGRAVQTVVPPASSITNTMLSPSVITGQTAETSVAGGDSVLIYDDSATALRKMTRTNFIGGGNTPAFFATMSADQTSIADSTFTKVQFDSERFDTNSAYDPTTNYRFTVPSGQGGKYFFSSIIFIQANSGQNIDACDYAFYINGAQNLYSGYVLVSNETSLNVSVNGFFNLSAGDYVEMFIFADTTSSATFNINQDTTTKARCFWYGYKIIE